MPAILAAKREQHQPCKAVGEVGPCRVRWDRPIRFIDGPQARAADEWPIAVHAHGRITGYWYDQIERSFFEHTRSLSLIQAEKNDGSKGEGWVKSSLVEPSAT